VASFLLHQLVSGSAQNPLVSLKSASEPALEDQQFVEHVFGAWETLALCINLHVLIISAQTAPCSVAKYDVMTMLSGGGGSMQRNAGGEKSEGIFKVLSLIV
jgi:hypothetical protein